MPTVRPGTDKLIRPSAGLQDEEQAPRRGPDPGQRPGLDDPAPPALTGKPATGTYRTAIDRNLPHGFTISRADLAACLLALLNDPAVIRHHVAIAS